MRIEHAARSLLGLLVLGAALAACGGAASTGATPGATQDGGSEAAETATYTGYLTALRTEERTVRLELVDVHAEAWQPAPDGGDRVDTEPLERAWPLATDARATVYECAQACETVAVPVADLADGSARPHHGEAAIFDIVVEDQQVISIAERSAP